MGKGTALGVIVGKEVVERVVKNSDKLEHERGE